MAPRSETHLDYEVMGGPLGDQTLVSRYIDDADNIRIEMFVIPDGTQGALVKAILKATDQNIRPDILQAECERDARVRWDRMGGPLLGPLAAMQRTEADTEDT